MDMPCQKGFGLQQKIAIRKFQMDSRKLGLTDLVVDWHKKCE